MGAELIAQLESVNDFLLEEGAPLDFAGYWKKPGAVSSFSLSFMFFDNISTTWLIRGRRFTVDWVQKKATLMYRTISSSGYGPSSSGSTSLSSSPFS